MERSTMNRRPKIRSIGWWKRTFDTVFSQYIRQKDAKNDIATCVTCGRQEHWKKMQNGHYIARNHMATRYDESNCHVQCIGCNMFKNGNMDEYALFLISKYGEGILVELNRKKQVITRISIPQYQEFIEIYKEKIKELDNERN